MTGAILALPHGIWCDELKLKVSAVDDFNNELEQGGDKTLVGNCVSIMKTKCVRQWCVRSIILRRLMRTIELVL